VADRAQLLFGQGAADDGAHIQEGPGCAEHDLSAGPESWGCGATAAAIRTARLFGPAPQSLSARHRAPIGAVGGTWRTRCPSHRRRDDEAHGSPAHLRRVRADAPGHPALLERNVRGG